MATTTRPNNSSSLEKQTWGTWEELLLACAVHRHGTESWDSVAMEVRKRSRTSTLHLLTPQSCRKKYLDLERRFNRRDCGVSQSAAATDDPNNIPWLDELKRIRVAELKRELERYDLSIVSLQLKVKRLKEEHEQSSGEIGKESGKSDLERTAEEKNDKDAGPAEQLPGNRVREPVSGEDSVRDNRSANVSNSTDPKHENPETGRQEEREDPGLVEPETEAVTGEGKKTAGEDSYNGSTDTMAKESPAENSERLNSERGVSDSPELGESVAESKGGGGGGGGEEGIKESSDVQSSVSLSRKKELEPDEPDNEDQSPAIKRVPVQSLPLADFLEVLRSHKFGCLFERRLDSQETPYYTNIIRQHMDLEKVRTRLEQGWYSGCNNKFFRDLLLLSNNAIVFYGNKSSESNAAMELRRLVLKEMASETPKSDYPSSKKQAPAPPVLPPAATSLKPKISVPITACRKRSSIALKATSGEDERRELTTSLVDKKVVPAADLKQEDKSSDEMDDVPVMKKRSRERTSTSGGRNSNKNSKSCDNISKNSDKTNSVSGRESNKAEKEKEKKSNTNASSSGKKQSASNFLNRMKRGGSSSNSGSLMDTLKTSAAGSEPSGKGGTDQQKKNANTKAADSQKDQRKGSSRGKQAKEQGSPGKRSVGRPPKRAAAPPPASSGKRNREDGEREAGSSRNTKKRSRK